MSEPTNYTCPTCHLVACVCGGPDATHGRFGTEHVDPETRNGFNPPYWAGAVQNILPIRLDPTSGALWSYQNGVWSNHRDVVADILPTKMGRWFRRGSIAHVETYLRAKLKRDGAVIHPDDPETRFVSLPSGLFNLATGEIQPHDSDVLTTYGLQVEPDFDSPTPEFDRFLTDVLHPGDDGRVLDILAYLLTPGNPLQRAVMLSGRGRNGKGVLMRLVELLIGKHNLASVSLQELSTRFAAADLYGVPLNMVGDIDGEHLTHTGRFKAMTGDDLVRMDVKNAAAFKANVWAVPVFSANRIPSSSDTSYGYLRRWEVVEFPNTFDGSDTTLEDRLRDELPAIAGKLLRHAVANLNTIRPSEPAARAHAEFARQSDPVRSWLGEMELSGFTSRKEAYEDYRAWIDDGNGKAALTKNNFYSRVEPVLGQAVKRRGTYGWVFGEVSTEHKMPPTEPKCPPNAPLNAPTYEAVTSDDGSQGAKGAGFVNSARGMIDSDPVAGNVNPEPSVGNGNPPRESGEASGYTAGEPGEASHHGSDSFKDDYDAIMDDKGIIDMNTWERTLKDRQHHLSDEQRSDIRADWNAVKAAGADGQVNPPGDYSSWYALKSIGLAEINPSGVWLRLDRDWRLPELANPFPA